MEVKMARGNVKKVTKTGAAKRKTVAPAPNNMGRRMMTTDLTTQGRGAKVQTKAKSGSKRGR
jgi:hypothetical protein